MKSSIVVAAIALSVVRAAAADDFHLASRNFQDFGQPIHKSLVRRRIHWGRTDADPQFVSQWSRDLVPRGPRLDLYGKQDPVRVSD